MKTKLSESSTILAPRSSFIERDFSKESKNENFLNDSFDSLESVEITNVLTPSVVDSSSTSSLVSINRVMSTLSPEEQVLCKEIAKSASSREHWLLFLMDMQRAHNAYQKELLEKIDLLQSDISILRMAQEEENEEKAKRMAERLAKAQRVKKPKRDTISRKELQSVLNKLDSGNLMDARHGVALITMYITGLRISNLLRLKVGDLRSLVRGKSITISLIKRGSKQHTIYFGEAFRDLLEENREHFSLLIDKPRRAEEFLFLTGRGALIGRENFTKGINRVLGEASQLFNKTLTSHSLRATAATELSECAPVHKVSQALGHASPASTLPYLRGGLSEREMIETNKLRAQLHFKEDKFLLETSTF